MRAAPYLKVVGSNGSFSFSSEAHGLETDMTGSLSTVILV